MNIGSYDTTRGRRYELALDSGKVIRGLTHDELRDIYEAMVLKSQVGTGV